MDMTRFFAYPTQDAAPLATDFLLLPAWGGREWSRLLDQTQTYRFASGDILIHQGDTERALYLVLAGAFAVEVPHGQTTRQVALIEAGSVVGEQAFFDTQPRSATIRATSNSEVARLSAEDFETFAAREPKLAHAVLFDLGRILSLRLRQHGPAAATLNEVKV